MLLSLVASCSPSQRADPAAATTQSHRGSLALVTRGETTLVDDYVRTPTTLEGLVQPRVRGAKFGWARYKVEFSPAGIATRSQLSLGRVGTSPTSTPVGTYATTFGPESIVEQWPNKTPTRTPYEEGTVPLFGPSLAMTQEIIARSQRIRGAQAQVLVPVYLLQTESKLTHVTARWTTPDSVTLSERAGAAAAFGFRDGQLLGGRSTDGEFVTVRREPPSEASALDSAARHVLAFLQGKASFQSIALADSVSLYVGKEAGGNRTTYARDQLREPSSWIARSNIGPYKLVPPALPKVTTKAGTHFVCREYQLATFFPDLARNPHVGVTLSPDSMQSCLQTWNVTFVFDSATQPRLVAAVYDQFEW